MPYAADSLGEWIATEPGGPVLVQRSRNRPAFAICTLVTDWQDYGAMRATFAGLGFGGDDCEYLVVDNSKGNRADAYVALNAFLQTACAPHIVLCHQDVRLMLDGRERLEAAIAELDALDPAWGLAGNAGFAADGLPHTVLSDPHCCELVYGGPFPAKVVSLDENFILVRRAANLALSRDLGGFHHYGTDLCLIAAVLGWNSWVIDFFLRHNGGGTVDGAYYASLDSITEKYRAAFAPRRIALMVGPRLFIARSKLGGRLSALFDRLCRGMGLYPRQRALWATGRKAMTERHRVALERLEQP